MFYLVLCSRYWSWFRPPIRQHWFKTWKTLRAKLVVCVWLSVKGHTEDPSGGLSAWVVKSADVWVKKHLWLLTIGRLRLLFASAVEGMSARHVSLPLSVCEPSDGLKRTAVVVAACPSVDHNSSSTSNYATFKSHGTECSDGKTVVCYHFYIAVSIPICVLNWSSSLSCSLSSTAQMYCTEICCDFKTMKQFLPLIKINFESLL